MKQKIDNIAEKIEEIMEWGGTGKDITLLVISAVALLISIFHLILGLPFDALQLSEHIREIRFLKGGVIISGNRNICPVFGTDLSLGKLFHTV